MNTNRTNIIAICAACLLFAAQAFAQDFPSYLTMDGTTVTGYTDDIPANLVIPDGITKIDGLAFFGCRSLASVVIPNSVKTIGDGAFTDCRSLASVTIPDSVATIDDHAFSWCTSLVRITIPESVTKIGMATFNRCVSLKEVKYLGTKAQWRSIDKGDDWHENVPAKKVVCKDGEADLD